jgi:hypothetical protein
MALSGDRGKGAVAAQFVDLGHFASELFAAAVAI